MTKKKKGMMAVYGNVLLMRLWCVECHTMAFVLDGEFKCCGAPYIDADKPLSTKRMCEPDITRKRPPKADQDFILNLQNYRCFYCDMQFGHNVYRNGKPLRLKIHWDHFVPFSYQQNNQTNNFVAACNVCNNIKTNKIFQTVEEAQVYVHSVREAKGYSTISPVYLVSISPETPVTENFDSSVASD